MMIANEKVLDRIEQSFDIFKKAFIYLVLPLFVYNIISFVFFALVLSYFLFSGILLSLFELLRGDIFLFFSDIKFLLLASLSLFFLLLYVLLLIPFLIYTIKTIGDFYNGVEKLDFKDNFLYATSRFFDIMRTYWYIFAYLALLPSLIFIIGGFIFNIGYFFDLQFNYKIIGGGFMLAGFLYFIVNMIYKGIKSTFALYSAIDNDSYTKEDFLQSVSVTDKNWWRIFGNLVLVGLIVGFFSGFASKFFSIFFGSFGNFTNLDFQNINKDTIQDFINAFSFFNYFVSGFFDNLIKTIESVFVYIFIYVFYKRLVFESNNGNNNEIEKEL
ncbi:MAG: hypothetical protein PHI37_04055 [Candidatus Gracilibacteria bacterium]|nr:hypothetical protein [Candidatus Gracilibacteria bacterium]